MGDDLVTRYNATIAIRPANKKLIADMNTWLDVERPMFMEQDHWLHEANDFVSVKDGDEDEFMDVLVGRLAEKAPVSCEYPSFRTPCGPWCTAASLAVDSLHGNSIICLSLRKNERKLTMVPSKFETPDEWICLFGCC